MNSPNAKMASMLEGMFKAGFSLDDIAARLNANTPNDTGSMSVDGETEEDKKRKTMSN
jgi:hypothetical protein